ncbi:MAG: hypothetical protein WBV89_15775, partial [Ilumatobacter sp.]
GPSRAASDVDGGGGDGDGVAEDGVADGEPGDTGVALYDAAGEPTDQVEAQVSPSAAETEVLEIVEATPVGWPTSGAYESTGEMPAASGVAHEPTTTMSVIGRAAGAGPAVTDQLPATGAPLFDGVDDVHEYTVESHGFRLRASFLLAILALGASLMAGAADTIDIRTSRPVGGIEVGIRMLEDFGSNLPIAGLIGVGVMLVGGFLSCFGLRWGAGLAGGAGLAVTGWAAMTIGLIEIPIHTAEGITQSAGANTNGFDLEITRDLGWFLIAVVGVLGVLVFLTTLRMAGTGGRPGLNPWIAAIGAVGAVIFAAGPLIPLGESTFDLNLGFVGLPRAFFAGRLVALGLIALTGIVGFLSVRTYGLGLVAGGISIATWLWATSLAEFGDTPVGVAVGNLGTTETVPHAVTSVGLAVSLVMLAVAAALASATRP